MIAAGALVALSDPLRAQDSRVEQHSVTVTGESAVAQAAIVTDAGPGLFEPPPMYLADPSGGSAFAAMPVGIGDGLAKSWPRWFFGASGLVMTRTLQSGAATMQPLDGEQLTTADAGANWPGGVDLHIGRWFGMRQQHAVEMIYWGVYNLGTSGSIDSSAGDIVAIPQAPGVTVSGVPASTYLADGAEQQISRSDVINDVEINWVYSLWDRPEFLPRERAVNLMWLAGFRFFQVGDTLTLQTTPADSGLGPLDLNVATNNNIYGAQVGAKFDWRMMPRLRLNIVPKFMIGGNAITTTTAVVQSNGDYGTFTADGSPSTVHSTLGVFSWLGSVDTAVAWDVTDRWSLWMGYRVVGVGNIAQADGQWPTVITSPGSISGIEAGSSTIVHGGFAGFEGRY
jgi:metal-sulfur cluster biosynthetic enzyme